MPQCSVSHRLFAVAQSFWEGYHFAERRKVIISKWLALSRDRRGQNTLPPREKSLSTAALDGNPVLSEMYSFRICGYKSNDDKSWDLSDKYLDSSSSAFGADVEAWRLAVSREKMSFSGSGGKRAGPEWSTGRTGLSLVVDNLAKSQDVRQKLTT